MIVPIQVVPGIYRGSEPTELADWQKLKDLGVKWTLDLETGNRVMNDGNPFAEINIAKEYGIAATLFPLNEFNPPTKQQLQITLSLLDISQTGGLPVYVHCRAGVDRTGMVIANYRMKVQGWSKDQAVKEMKALGMHWFLYWWIWSL